MPWTPHGHWFGSSREPSPEDLRHRPGQIARCGGPGMCGECSRFAAGPKPNVNRTNPQSSMMDQQVQSILGGAGSILFDTFDPKTTLEMVLLRGQQVNKYRTRHIDQDATDPTDKDDAFGVWDSDAEAWVMDPEMSEEKAQLHSRILNLEYYLAMFGENQEKMEIHFKSFLETSRLWFEMTNDLINWAQKQGYQRP